MNNPPATRPPHVEIERQRNVADMQRHAGDDYEWRMKLAEVLASIQADLRVGQTWMETHDKRDDERFRSRDERDDERFLRLEGRIGSVSSGVNEFTEAKQQLTGAKKLVLGVVAIVSVIGGAVLGAIEIIKFLGKAPP